MFSLFINCIYFARLIAFMIYFLASILSNTMKLMTKTKIHLNIRWKSYGFSNQIWVMDLLEKSRLLFFIQVYIKCSDYFSHPLIKFFSFRLCKIVISSLALTVNYNQRGFLKLISEVIAEMFRKPTTPFWTGRAMDFLFDGIVLFYEIPKNHFQIFFSHFLNFNSRN